MAYKVKKSCRICGKVYTPCADCENDKTAFHWRTVACSYECGMEYFKRVLDERNKTNNSEEFKPFIVSDSDKHAEVNMAKENEVKPKYTKKKKIVSAVTDDKIICD